MTTKEAIDVLVFGLYFDLVELKEHSEYDDEGEMDDYQKEHWEEIRAKIEALQVILGDIDPSLGTFEGIQEKCSALAKEKFGSSELDGPVEVGDIERELYTLLEDWQKRRGSSDDFELTDEENLELAKINMESGKPRWVVDDEEPIESDESDTFGFYPYHGRVFVVYNYDSDGDFSSYPEEFQKKALELIKEEINEETF